MQESGEVVELKNGLASIRMTRSEACAHCSGGCKPGENSKHMYIEAVDQVGVRLGDKVMVELPSSSMAKATFILYFIPLLALVFGVLLGFRYGQRIGFSDGELGGAVLGIIGVLLSYGLIKLFEPRFRKTGNYLPRIRKVL